jgi:hypothetical protein
VTHTTNPVDPYTLHAAPPGSARPCWVCTKRRKPFLIGRPIKRIGKTVTVCALCADKMEEVEL